MTIWSRWGKSLQKKTPPSEFQFTTLKESTNQKTSGYKYNESYPIVLSKNTNLERFLAQTHTSPNLSVESCYGACGKHWKKPSIGGRNLKLIMGFE